MACAANGACNPSISVKQAPKPTSREVRCSPFDRCGDRFAFSIFTMKPAKKCRAYHGGAKLNHYARLAPSHFTG